MVDGLVEGDVAGCGDDRCLASGYDMWESDTWQAVKKVIG